MCGSDIKAVIDVAHAAGQKVKVIFENCYLDDAQKIQSLRNLWANSAPTG